MPVLALISMAWVYRVRIEKSLQMAKSNIKSLVIVRQLDLGWVQKSVSKRFDWLEPSILRAIELGVLIAVFAITGQLTGESAITDFVILFSIAFHHYDNLYRAMQGEQKPSWLGGLGLSLFGRLGLTSLALAGVVDVWLVACYFIVIFLLGSSIQWIYTRRQRPTT